MHAEYLMSPWKAQANSKQNVKNKSSYVSQSKRHEGTMLVKLKVIWSIICLIGNIAQIYHISLQYFLYDVTTNVQLYIPDTIDLPSLSVCFYSWKLLKWSQLSAYEKQSLLTINGEDIYRFEQPYENLTSYAIRSAIENGTTLDATTLLKNMQKKLNISDMFRLTASPFEVFSPVAIYNPQQRGFDFLVNGSDLMKPEEFFFDNRKCLVFNLEEKGRSNVSYFANRRINIMSGIASMYFFSEEYVSAVNEPVIALSSGKDYVRPDFNGFLAVPSQLRVGITYTEYRSILLPSPYATNCRNYLASGFISRGKCYDVCLKAKSLHLWGSLHPLLQIFPKEKEKIITYDELFFQYSHEANRIDTECTEECKQRDCSTVQYIPRYMLFGKPYQAEQVRFFLMVTLSPITESITVEHYLLIQFVTDIASTFGFWLGLNLYAIVGFLSLMLKYLKKVRLQRGNRVFCHPRSRSQQKDEHIQLLESKYNALQNELAILSRSHCNLRRIVFHLVSLRNVIDNTTVRE